MFTPKGQSRQVKGSLCNVPILEVPKKSLREPAASNVLATVKQKAKKKNRLPKIFPSTFSCPITSQNTQS